MARILVIDDDPAVRESTKLLLTLAGHEVRCAPDGAVGEVIAAAFRPALAIVDLLMPVREGLETIQSVRRRQPETKIIAISGGGSLGTLDFLAYARGLGADATLAKPCDGAELMATVSALLAQTSDPAAN